MESIKDKFNELENMMVKLELKDDIERAAAFLNEQVQISYYGVISSISAV